MKSEKDLDLMYETAELIAAIEGHPGAVKNELKRLVDTGEIVKVRRAMYALPKA